MPNVFIFFSSDSFEFLRTLSMATPEEQTDFETSTVGNLSIKDAESGRPTCHETASINSNLKQVTRQSSRGKFKMAAKFDMKEQEVSSDIKESMSEVFNRSGLQQSAKDESASASALNAATSDAGVASSSGRGAGRGNRGRGWNRGKTRGRGRGDKGKETQRPGRQDFRKEDNTCITSEEVVSDLTQGRNEHFIAPNSGSPLAQSTPSKQEQSHNQFGQRTSVNFKDRVKGHESDQDEFFDAEDYGSSEHNITSVDQHAKQQRNNRGYEHESLESNEPTEFKSSAHNQHGRQGSPVQTRGNDSSTQRFSTSQNKSRRKKSLNTKSQPNDSLRNDKPQTDAGYQPIRQTPHIPSIPTTRDRMSAEAESTPGKIVVSGLDPSIDEDILSMYFENNRKSGGGDVENVHLNPSDNSATVTFKDLSGKIYFLDKHGVSKFNKKKENLIFLK